jgi:serine/threonine protein kinase
VSLRPPPRLVGRYLLCDLIASGGMASVHLARLVGQEGFTRTVALKQLYPHFSRDPEFVAMFLDEARLLSRIRHTNVVAPLDIIVEDQELFIAMEYVHGEALSHLVEQANGPVEPALATGIVVQALLGLHAAHEATGEDGRQLAIVHRDVSPQNILVGLDGIARIVDFGIAKAASRSQTTGAGSLKGKLGYMAPEQVRLEPVDRRADLFTTGIVLWELLVGERLFPGDHPGAVVDAILSGDVPPPRSFVSSLPAALEQVVLRALALHPDDRFGSAKEMAGALARATPAASSIEIGAWVEALAAPELARRVDLISDVERISIADLTLSRRSASRGPLGTDPIAFPLIVSRESSTPAGREAHVASLTPSSETFVPATRKRRLSAALAALVLLGVAGFVWFALARGPGSSAPAASLVLEPMPTATAELPLRDAEAGALSLVTARPEPPAPGSTSPAASAPAASPTRPPDQKPLSGPGGPRTNEKVAPHRIGAGSTPSTEPEKPSPPVRATSDNRCLVPYKIDANGIKRFKPECF